MERPSCHCYRGPSPEVWRQWFVDWWVGVTNTSNSMISNMYIRTYTYMILCTMFIIAYIIVMLYTCFLCSNSFDKQVFLILWEPCGILVSLAKHPLPSAPTGPKISRSVQLLPNVASIMTISQKRPCASKAQHSCECKRGGMTLQAKKALSIGSFPAWSHDQWPMTIIYHNAMPKFQSGRWGLPKIQAWTYPAPTCQVLETGRGGGSEVRWLPSANIAVETNGHWPFNT